MSQDQPEIIFAHTTAVAADPNRGVTPKNLGANFTPIGLKKKPELNYSGNVGILHTRY